MTSFVPSELIKGVNLYMFVLVGLLMGNYFTMYTSFPIPHRKNFLLDQNHISRQNQNQDVGD